MKRLILATALALVTLGGCEPAPDVEPGSCENLEPSRLRLGHGNVGGNFVPLEDGDEVDAMFSPNGAPSMVPVSLRLSDFVYPEPPFVFTEGNAERNRSAP